MILKSGFRQKKWVLHGPHNFRRRAHSKGGLEMPTLLPLKCGYDYIRCCFPKKWRKVSRPKSHAFLNGLFLLVDSENLPNRNGGRKSTNKYYFSILSASMNFLALSLSSSPSLIFFLFKHTCGGCAV